VAQLFLFLLFIILLIRFIAASLDYDDIRFVAYSVLVGAVELHISEPPAGEVLWFGGDLKCDWKNVLLVLNYCARVRGRNMKLASA
jgi:hypothetical protein